jgi:hypothetical protein
MPLLIEVVIPVTKDAIILCGHVSMILSWYLREVSVVAIELRKIFLEETLECFFSTLSIRG